MARSCAPRAPRCGRCTRPATRRITSASRFIPVDGGDLNDYLRSLERLLDEAPGSIYPAHGPRIPDGAAKIREYIAHRIQREGEILDALERGGSNAREIVELVYVGYPATLHPPARYWMLDLFSGPIP